jgi:hypothetical protein
MKNKAMIYVLIIFFISCTPKKEQVREGELGTVFLSESDSVCLKKKRLVETVLNFPDVIRYSRLQNVRKAFDTIFIAFNENDMHCILPPYIQQGDTLAVMTENDPINTIKKPIYEVKEMVIIGDSAYVYFEFDITGAIAYGSLRQLNEQWVPDSSFVMGVR